MKNTSFFRNIGIVAVGPVLASLLGFFAEPIIARLWTPSVYGLGSYFNSILQIFTPILFLRYNFAIVQAKNEFEEANLLALSLLIMGILIVFVLLGFPLLNQLSLNSFQLSEYKCVFMMALTMGALSILLRFWFSSKKRFLQLSTSYIMFQLPPILLLIILGYMGYKDEHTMILIRSSAYFMFPVLLLFEFFKKDLTNWIRLISFRGVRDVAKSYKSYPLHEYLGFVANIVAFNLPVILIARYWGKEVTGLYAKAFLLLYMVVTILGDSVNRVFHKEVADMLNEEKDIAVFVQHIAYLIVVMSIIPFTLIVVAGPEIFSVFLGDKWKMSGVFAQSMAIWSFATLLNMAILPLYGVLNRQKHYSLFTFLTLLLRGGILSLMGVLQINVVLTLYVYAVANFMVLSWQSFYIMHASGISYRWSVNLVFAKVLRIAPMVIILFVLRSLVYISPKLYLTIVFGATLPYLYWFYFKEVNLSRFLRVGIPGFNS